MTPKRSLLVLARLRQGHARTPGRTGGPGRRAHHTTGTAPAGHRNQRKTGRHPPGTRRTADTSPLHLYTPARPRPATPQPSDAGPPLRCPEASGPPLRTRQSARDYQRGRHVLPAIRNRQGGWGSCFRPCLHVLRWCGRRVGGLGPGLTSESADALSGCPANDSPAGSQVSGTHRRAVLICPSCARGRGSQVRRPAGACHPFNQRKGMALTIVAISSGDGRAA
jgi:hypothetical protein